MAGFQNFTPRTANLAEVWKGFNPAANFLGGAKAVQQMDLDAAAEERLRELADTDRMVKETLLPLQVEQARANILSTNADIGYKGAMANYYATGKAKAATLAQGRLSIANAIEPMSFYKSPADETPQGPSLNLQTPVSIPQENDDESLLDNFLGSSSDSESSVFDDMADARDLSRLPNNAKIASNSSGMDPTTYQAMNNASKALEEDNKTFDLAATAETFSARPNPQTASEIKNANIEAGVTPPERLKNKSALAAYMRESEPPSLEALVEDFDTKKAYAKTFIDNNQDSQNLDAWGTAQSLKMGIPSAYSKFDNDLQMGRYGISAAQVDRVLQKYPANYAAVGQIAPYLQGSGDIDEAMARYEQDKTNRVEGDKTRIARKEKLQDARIALLGQSGEMTPDKRRALGDLERELNMLQSPQEKLSQFSEVDSEAQNLARGWAKTAGEKKPTVNYLGEPMDTAADKTTYDQKFQQLATSGNIPVATGEIQGEEVDGNWDQVAMWFKSKGMEMPENTPVTAGVYIKGSLIPFQVSYSRGKNGVDFSARPLTPLSNLPQENMGNAENKNESIETKYSSAARQETANKTSSELKTKIASLKTEIADLTRQSENVRDVDYMPSPLGVQQFSTVSKRSAAAMDADAKKLLEKRNRLQAQLTELESKNPKSVAPIKFDRNRAPGDPEGKLFNFDRL